LSTLYNNKNKSFSEKHCKICGTPFKAKFNNLTCSPQCSKINRNNNLRITNNKYYHLKRQGLPDKRRRIGNTCCRCGIPLAENNWPINARKHPNKIWRICEYCFKERMANNQYKFHTNIVLRKRIKTGKCELCCKQIPKEQRLSWHHWDDSDTSKGVWVCNPCHWIAESVEKHQDIIEQYLTWKQVTESPRYKNVTFESGTLEVIV